jgi:hypothetical protein
MVIWSAVALNSCNQQKQIYIYKITLKDHVDPYNFSHLFKTYYKDKTDAP